MRDRFYWYKTPSSPQWKLMDVTALAARPQPQFNGYSLPANFGANRTWFEDFTSIACASPVKAPKAPHPPFPNYVARGGLGVVLVLIWQCSSWKLSRERWKEQW